MWCANCQSEVAAEASPETGEVRCASCGTELSNGKFARLDQHLRQARELLDRWSREPLLEPYSPLPAKQAASLEELPEAESTENIAAAPLAAHPPTAPEHTDEPIPVPPAQESLASDAEDVPASDTVATSEPLPPIAAATPAAPDPPAASPQPSREPIMHGPRIDTRHAAASRMPPHFDVQKFLDEPPARDPKQPHWMMLAGQWLAYLGVLGLTAGASLVVYGYFGGEPDMTPKGWMLTTAGQMLLFLGIVTLISGGLEQANQEVSQKIDQLGTRLLRFEQHVGGEALRGPKIPARAYADTDAAAPESSETSSHPREQAGAAGEPAQ